MKTVCSLLKKPFELTKQNDFKLSQYLVDIFNSNRYIANTTNISK